MVRKISGQICLSTCAAMDANAQQSELGHGTSAYVFGEICGDPDGALRVAISWVYDDKAFFRRRLDEPARVPMLASRKVQNIDLFLMSEPSIKRAISDGKPVCLFAGDLGLEIYANSIGVPRAPCCNNS